MNMAACPAVLVTLARKAEESPKLLSSGSSGRAATPVWVMRTKFITYKEYDKESSALRHGTETEDSLEPNLWHQACYCAVEIYEHPKTTKY